MATPIERRVDAQRRHEGSRHDVRVAAPRCREQGHRAAAEQPSRVPLVDDCRIASASVGHRTQPRRLDGIVPPCLVCCAAANARSDWSQSRCTYRDTTVMLAGCVGARRTSRRGLWRRRRRHGHVPTPGITSIAQGTRTVAGDAIPDALVTGGQIDSSASKGYTATIPDGWNCYPNLIQAARRQHRRLLRAARRWARTSRRASPSLASSEQAPSEAEHQAFEATTVPASA